SILILSASCMPALERAQTLPPESTPTATEPVCQPSPILESPNSFPEVQARMHSEGEIWALLFFGEAHANEELKIVWRIDAPEPGTEVRFQAHNEEGTIIQPIWGPTFHPESTWERPGLEWGIGFNFPEPGCWTITATLGETEGEISLEVLDL
ncbi:MAG TPA: hypothetical protein VK880_12830, partial [Anaerolineales bacterium]|nr:hypothetical protein [Anaerolineales bacterium]